MKKLRSVNTKFWDDAFICELAPPQKLIFLYLLTNSLTNVLGIYEITLKKISFDTGINKETISKAFEHFEKVKKVFYIDNYIILPNFIKNQSMNTNMKTGSLNVYNELPNELKNKFIDNASKDFETLVKAFECFENSNSNSNIEDEIKDEDVKEKINDIYLEFDFLKDEFKEIWFNEFIPLKKKKKASVTDRALKSQLNKIQKLSNGIYNIALEILEKSVNSGWTDFYELKKDFNNGKPNFDDRAKEYLNR